MEDTSKRVDGKQTALFRAQGGRELEGAGGASPVHPHLSITPVVDSPVRQAAGETQGNPGFADPNLLRVRSDSVSSNRSIASSKSSAFSGVTSYMEDYNGTDYDWYRLYCQDKCLLEGTDNPYNRALQDEFDLYMKNTCLNLYQKYGDGQKIINQDEKNIIELAKTCFNSMIVMQRAYIVSSKESDKVGSRTTHKEKKEFNATVIKRMQAGDLTEETISYIIGERNRTHSNASSTGSGASRDGRSPAEEWAEKVEKEQSDLGTLLDQGLSVIEDIVTGMKSGIRPNYTMVIKNGIKDVDSVAGKLKTIRARMRAAQILVPTAAQPTASTGIPRETATPSPATSQRKRSRSSPELAAAGKRTRTDLPTPPQAIHRQPRAGGDPSKQRRMGKKGPPVKKKEGAPPARWRNDAVVVKPGTGKSYADALRDIKQRLATGEVASDIAGIRKTRSGHVLIEIPKGDENAQAKTKIKEAAQQVGETRELRPMVELELRDLEAIITKEEVEEDLKKVLGDHPSATEKMRISKENSRGVRMAIFEVPEETAALLFTKTTRGRIKIGMICSELRRRAQVPRCYKCLGYGHLRWQCSGVDRTGMCFKCGSADHKGTQCTSAPKCVLCQEKGLRETEHIPGTGKCAVYREALQTAKAKKPRGPGHRST